MSPILPTTPFLWEKSEPSIFLKISKTQLNSDSCGTNLEEENKFHILLEKNLTLMSTVTWELNREEDSFDLSNL